ncbi:class I SAM-dependent methyltransferase [Myxococcus faecalis]|uniref:class I SAM-dependent methyltransferase n=1 Tax=Myxococcus faecalis TaxID=3115646 RepID=UPI0024C574A4|nr:class I SAM-dependent methyltransferase [Myxococcus sp. MH1]
MASIHEHHGQQKAFFEADPGRIATRLFRHPSFPRTMRRKLSFLARELAGSRHVLEVGVGQGLQLSYFLSLMPESCRYTGVDIAEAPLLEARKRLAPHLQERVTLQHAVAERLPFEDGTFDAAFCLDVLHHAASQPSMLAEMKRVVRPGGQIICVEPNPLHPANLVFLRDPIEKGIFQLTSANAREWTRHAGLEQLRLENLPVFFPSFPGALENAYGLMERVLARVPVLNRFSTTRVLRASRPEEPRG